MKKAEKAVVGDWRITSMEMWDADYFDMEVPAHITIREDLLGAFQFGLVQGELETFLGFSVIRVDGTRIDGTKILPIISGAERACLAWQRDQVVLGLGQEPSARITERPDKNYATQVFYSMSAGATRMQENGVVEIACVE